MRFFTTPKLIQFLFPNWNWKGVGKDSIYLTFDDGPNKKITPWILSYLKSKNIKATFFCVGEMAAQSPEILEEIINDGHAIGHHTMHHENGWKTAINDYLEAVKQSSRFINSNLFRPPYGKITLAQSKKLRNNGFNIIMWTWLSYDFDPKVSAKKIVSKAKKIKGGDILVFHDNARDIEKTKEILPPIINELLGRGLNFKTLA
jgi:peptidoglycan/xylan/chitin deacetylase (PgdA/CDA1 family)